MTIETSLKIVSALPVIFYLILAHFFATDAPESVSGLFALLMIISVIATSILTHFL